MLRENKRRSVAGSVKSGRSSISTLTQLDFSLSSGISAITMDDDLGSKCDRSSIASYSRNFGPKLRTMHEQQRASDPDMDEVQEYLDAMRVASNNNRFSSICDSDAMCHIPRRKSSSSNLDYRTAHSGSMDTFFTLDGDLSANPLHGDIDSCDSFFSGVEEADDEVLPLSFTPRSQRSSQRSSQRNSHITRSLAYYGTMMSSISLDIGDVFDDDDDEDDEEKHEEELKRVSSTSVDVSPQVARRRSSLSTYGSSKDLSAKIPTVSLLEDSSLSLGDSKARPVGDSGEICLAGDERFKTKCPKEKSNSITRPRRRVSGYTLDLRPIQLATCMQG